jgi:competence protein ComEA
MTWLQGLFVKLLMLAVTVGVLYWAVNPETVSEPEQAVVVRPPADDEQGGDEPGETPQAAPNSPARPVRTSAVSSPARPVPPPRRVVKFPLDINKARLEDLMELPGIGEKLAQRMVEYRKSQGGFRSVDELRKVRGIGEKRMERLRPLVMTAEVP